MRRAVAAQHRPLPLQRGADGARHEPAVVQVAAAVEVAAARDHDGQVVGERVALGDQVGAALGHVVGVAAGERMVLLVRELRLAAVGLVGRCDHDPGRAAAAAAGVEHLPRALDVRAHGVAPGRAGRARRSSARRGGRRRRSRTRPAPARSGGRRAGRRRRVVQRRPPAPVWKRLCGTRSRTSATTSAPRAVSASQSHDPSRPVAPVTSTGRSVQKLGEAADVDMRAGEALMRA